jgi:hypothetical protein
VTLLATIWMLKLKVDYTSVLFCLIRDPTSRFRTSQTSDWEQQEGQEGPIVTDPVQSQGQEKLDEPIASAKWRADEEGFLFNFQTVDLSFAHRLLKGGANIHHELYRKKIILGGELYAGIYDSDSDYDSSHDDSSSEEGMILLLYSC